MKTPTSGSRLTIKELVDKNKIVLDGIFVELAKVLFAQAYKPVDEFKDDSGIGVTFGDGHNVYVFVFDMTEGGGAESEDGRSDLCIGDDLDAKDVGEARPAVWPKGTEDEILALLIEEQDAAQHRKSCRRCCRSM